MRAAWLIALLFLVPAVSAQSVTIHGPDEAYLGNARMFTYTVEGTEGIQGHVDVELTVLRDGAPVLETASLHEHDGIHSFVFTPRETGLYEFMATTSAGTTTHAMVVDGEWAERYGHGSSFSGSEGMYENGRSWSWGSSSHPVAWIESVDADGQLLAGSFQRDGHSIIQSDHDDFGYRALQFQDPGEANGAPSWHTFGGSNPFFDGDGGFPTVLLPDLGMLDLQQLDLCGELVWDPTGVTADGTPQFQEHANIRLSWPNHGLSDLVYSLVPAADGVDNRNPHATMASADEWGHATFRPPGPGSFEIIATGSDMECRAPFDVTANPTPAGTLHVSATTSGTMTTLRWEAVSNGQPLGHYEYDARILRPWSPLDESANWLKIGSPMDVIWAGKLHAHGGNATMSLSGLAAGNYTVITHASPQDPTSPPVAPADHHTFTVDLQSDEEAAKATPMPFVFALFALIALRRRS